MAANMVFYAAVALLLLLSQLVFLLRSSTALPLHPVPLTGLQLRGGAQSSGHGDVIIFHPPTGLCVVGSSAKAPLKLGPCEEESNAWRHTSQSLLMVKNTYFCLRASSEDKPVRLAPHCSPSDSRWVVIFNSGGGEDSRLTTRLSDGRSLCLDVDSEKRVVSRRCDIMRGGRSSGSGSSQWFRVGEQSRKQILPGRRVDPKDDWFSWFRWMA